MSDEVIDLTSALDSEITEGVDIYIDWAHISEYGNALVAREMSKVIIDYLQET